MYKLNPSILHLSCILTTYIMHAIYNVCVYFNTIIMYSNGPFTFPSTQGLYVVCELTTKKKGKCSNSNKHCQMTVYTWSARYGSFAYIRCRAPCATMQYKQLFSADVATIIISLSAFVKFPEIKNNIKGLCKYDFICLTR